VWTWALLAGGLGIIALVLALRVANRAASRRGRRDSDHGDDVCRRPPGFHADPVAILRGPAALVWHSGADASFWISLLALLGVAAAMTWAYIKLARVAKMSLA
jgi:hypothetical protein